MKRFTLLVSIMLSIWCLSEPIYAETETPVDLFKQTCTQCHLLNRIHSKTKTKTGWEKTVDRMLKKLAARDKEIKISQEKAEQITAYLYVQRGYTNPKTGDKKAEERKRRFRRKYPPSEPRTGSSVARADTTQVIEPRLLDQQFSAKKLANKTVFILPFRDTSGKDSDFSSPENILFELAKDKFPATKRISREGIDQMEAKLAIGPLNSWHSFLNQYNDTGRIKTDDIVETVLKPQKIDYLLTASLTGHTVGSLRYQVYEYFASITFWDTEQEKFVYNCSFEGQVEYRLYAESLIEADKSIYREAFYKMLNKIPKDLVLTQNSSALTIQTLFLQSW